MPNDPKDGVISLEEARARVLLKSQGVDVDAEWRMLMQKLEERGVIDWTSNHRHPRDRFPNVWRALLDTADGCENIVTAVTGDPDRWSQMDADRREIVALAVFDAMLEARLPPGTDDTGRGT